jgi:hypothetical protein
MDGAQREAAASLHRPEQEYFPGPGLIEPSVTLDLRSKALDRAKKFVA